MVSRNRRPLIVLAALSSLLLAAAPAASQAADDGPEAAPNELLVGFEPGASAGDRAQARRSNDARLIEVVVADDTGRGVVERVAIPNGSDRARYERRFESNPTVAYAEPNWKVDIVDIVETSNDPYYTDGSLWGMYGDATSPANAYGSQAGEAWASGNVGSSDVWVGVIDQGIQHSHPDLDANVGPNPYETPGNGIDDDGNGYVDDVYGWDFYNNDNSVYDSKKHDEHGTHVAGTIGGEGGNGIGVAGVNWNVKMLSGKFLGPRGGYTSDAVKAVDYFTDLKKAGLNVVATNNSWGGGGYSTTLYEAIARAEAQDILFVAAAGNSGVNTDTSPHYPSSYNLDNIISVAALTKTGALASWSNYGATTVDLAAPGAGIYSTVPDGYASFSGTSMAAPHVAGAAALYKAANPTATMTGIRKAIFDSAVFTASVDGKVVTNGRLDVSSFFVSVTGNPPEATTTSASTEEDTAVPITLAGTDAETCELEFAIVSAPTHGALSGVTSPSDNCTGSSGSWADSASVTYTPAADHNGSDSFSYSVRDAAGNTDSSTVSVNISAVNDAPVAVEDRATTAKDTDVKIEVLANDSDVDGDALTVAPADVAPAHGSITINSDQTVTYTPDVGFTGDDSFTYEVSDPELESDVGTVTVTVSDATVATASVENYSAFGGKLADNHLDITIRITDKNDPAAGLPATVSIQLYRNGSPVGGSLTGSTDGAGSITFGYRGVGPGCYATDVTAVSPSGGYTWDGSEVITVFSSNAGACDEALAR